MFEIRLFFPQSAIIRLEALATCSDVPRIGPPFHWSFPFPELPSKRALRARFASLTLRRRLARRWVRPLGLRQSQRLCWRELWMYLYY